MKDSQYLCNAIDFIVEREEDGDFICERLHDIPEEAEICSKNCQNLNRNCVLRFLKHYKEAEQLIE